MQISVELILHCVYLNADLFPYFPHPAPQAVVITPEVKEEPTPPAPTPTKEEPTPVLAPPKPEPEPATPATPATPPPPVPVEKDQAAEPPKNHEPHLGPKPRSHNRVLNPPGGKSSVVFYWWASTPPYLCPYHPCSAPLLIFTHSSSPLLTVGQARISLHSFHQI